MSTERLRRLPLFAGLSDEDFQRLLDSAETVTLPAGAMLMQEGTPGDALYVVAEGEFEVTKRSGQQEVPIAVRGPGEIFGEMSLLDQAPRSASARALRDSRLVKISREAFQALLAASPVATLAILHTVTSRLRNTESMLRQHEKMAALGALAAGLAHELNNPAAAVKRGVEHLRAALAEWQRLGTELEFLELSATQRALLARVGGWGEVAAGGSPEGEPRATLQPPPSSPLARADREAEVQDWLEVRGVERTWELAPTLVAAGWGVQELDGLAAHFAARQAPLVARWLGTSWALRALLDEVATGADRVSEIVTAVKTYAYLDRGAVQEVDVHADLENSLVILRHKLKQGVKVRREYAPDLPRIEAYASELVQVWTNLIDNALDALGGQGELMLRTAFQGGEVAVEVADTGPGIPSDLQPRVFEPFFTTKPPGQGTGLGLHLAYNVVVFKHHGRIELTSRPGATRFRVTLPVRLRREASRRDGPSSTQPA